MTDPQPHSARAHLQRLGVDHTDLSQVDVLTLSYILHGWQIRPRTAADDGPIRARVWLLAALNARGRYIAPEALGHPADLEDGGDLIDSVILMAIIQRHFLPVRQRAWDDAALAAQLGFDTRDVTRAQALLDRTAPLLRTPHPALLGANWWVSVTSSE